MSAADQQSPAAPQTRPYNYTLTGGDIITIEIDDGRDELLTPFGKATMTDRYLLPGESYQDMFARVACANSDEVVRNEETGHAQRIYDYMSKLWFMPSTPVLTNSGTERGLPVSCFLNTVGDSMESIAEAVHENIWLAAKGGGIGTSWSDVRSIGESIAGSLTGSTSGIVPFIKWQDAQTLAISQGSLRRGSAAVYLDVEHPEIEEFIDIRRPSGGDPRRKAHNIHHGVMVGDDFMNMAFNDDASDRQWELKSPKTGETIKTVDARELLIKLLVTRLETGEPYIVFKDTVNRSIPEIQKALGLKVKQSNLCSEITLPTGEDHLGNWRTAVCCLSSLNFETLDQWEGDDKFIFDVMEFLDNVLQLFIDRTEGVKGFERARYSAERERSVGLGMMGFHSYLQSRNLPYEGVHAGQINTRVWKWLSRTAEIGNSSIADARGECLDSIDARGRFDPIDPSAPAIHLKRMSNVFSIAPTASISIICGGASPAGEPWPANSFTQKTLSGSFEVRNPYLDAQLRRRYRQLSETLHSSEISTILKTQSLFKGVEENWEDDWIEEQWQSITINDGSVQHLEYLCPLEKAIYRTAFELDQRWIVRHHAERAPYICQAQSVNLFMPASIHKKDLVEVHKMAWESGLKSLYYIRSRSVSKAVAVGSVAGEMPNADIEQTTSAGPLYVDPEECESCQ